MVVAQDACLRINRGWYSRMGGVLAKFKEAPVAPGAPGAPGASTGAPGANGASTGAPGAAPGAASEATNGAAGGKRKGGYRPTKKDKAALKKLKQGKSIGFTMRSSLKAKGLLRRANGTMRVSAKYKKN